jgi:hypothetical protein
MADFVQEAAFDIGRRVEIRGPYAWCVVLKPAQGAESALEDFAAEIAAVIDRPVRIVRDLAAQMEGLRTELHEPAGDAVVISGLDSADASLWRMLDVNRSGLARPGPVVLWLSAAGIAGLCEYAPNLRSFIGGSIFYLGTHGESITAEERGHRISDLEAHFQMTSADMIRRAESGTLPTEPHFVEWLVLLDRGDLV